MKLEEYLYVNRISRRDFADKLHVSVQTLHNIIKGNETRLSTALLIEELTKNEVRCQDLRPTERRANDRRGNLRTSQLTKKNQEDKSE